MKKYIYICILFFCFSFNNYAQEKAQKPRYTGENTTETIPMNTVWIAGKIHSKTLQGEDCNQQKVTVVEFEVSQILGTGREVINSPKKGKKMYLVVPKILRKTLERKRAQRLYYFYIKENLCTNNTSTSFKITGFAPSN